MARQDTDLSTRGAARVAGIALLAIAVLAIFANFVVIEGLVVPGDAATTSTNITGSELLFRIGIAAWAMIAVLDIVVAWALYIVLRPVNRSVSLLAAWLRLAYAAVLAGGTAVLFGVLQLVSDAPYLQSLGEAGLRAQVMLSLDLFDRGWLIGLLIFGVHLGAVGYLAYVSGYMPKVLAVLLMLASASYLIDNLGQIVVSDWSPTITLVLAIPAAVGEISLAVWLLARADRVAAS